MSSPTLRNPLVLVNGFPREVTSGDVVNVTDAAEDTLAISVPFTFTTAGDNTIISPPTPNNALRLRRLMPTMADPDGSSNPLLMLKFQVPGASSWTEIARGFVMSGRFNILGPVGSSIVINLAKTGSVSGTVFYEVV